MSLAYRLHLLVPLAYSEAVRARFGSEGQKVLLEDVRRRVAALGFVDPQLVMQDPTDNHRFTAVVGSSADPLFRFPARGGDGVISVVGIEPVELPAPARPCGDPRLDPGLSADECSALRIALGRDRDPKHLEGFAESMTPVFPISAALLLAKKRTVAHDPPEIVPPTPSAEILRRRNAAEAYAVRNSLPLDLMREEVRRAAVKVADGDTVEAAPEVYALGRSVVRSNPEGRRIVDPELLKLAAPYDGREDYIPPSAAKLALAVGKPQTSGVADRARVSTVNRRLASPINAEERALALRAHSSMERAYRALDRGRWVRWYLRGERLKAQG